MIGDIASPRYLGFALVSYHTAARTQLLYERKYQSIAIIGKHYAVLGKCKQIVKLDPLVLRYNRVNWLS